MLHYLTPEDQINLMDKCLKQINPGGIMVIRDGNSNMKKRHKGTRMSEFFSTKTGFNKTKNPLFFFSQKFVEDFAGKHDLKLEIVDQTKLTSNLIYILRK